MAAVGALARAAGNAARGVPVLGLAVGLLAVLAVAIGARIVARLSRTHIALSGVGLFSCGAFSIVRLSSSRLRRPLAAPADSSRRREWSLYGCERIDVALSALLQQASLGVSLQGARVHIDWLRGRLVAEVATISLLLSPDSSFGRACTAGLEEALSAHPARAAAKGRGAQRSLPRRLLGRAKVALFRLSFALLTRLVSIRIGRINVLATQFPYAPPIDQMALWTVIQVTLSNVHLLTDAACPLQLGAVSAAEFAIRGAGPIAEGPGTQDSAPGSFGRVLFKNDLLAIPPLVVTRSVALGLREMAIQLAVTVKGRIAVGLWTTTALLITSAIREVLGPLPFGGEEGQAGAHAQEGPADAAAAAATGASRPAKEAVATRDTLFLSLSVEGIDLTLNLPQSSPELVRFDAAIVTADAVAVHLSLPDLFVARADASPAARIIGKAGRLSISARDAALLGADVRTRLSFLFHSTPPASDGGKGDNGGDDRSNGGDDGKDGEAEPPPRGVAALVTLDEVTLSNCCLVSDAEAMPSTSASAVADIASWIEQLAKGRGKGQSGRPPWAIRDWHARCGGEAGGLPAQREAASSFATWIGRDRPMPSAALYRVAASIPQGSTMCGHFGKASPLQGLTEGTLLARFSQLTLLVPFEFLLSNFIDHIAYLVKVAKAPLSEASEVQGFDPFGHTWRLIVACDASDIVIADDPFEARLGVIVAVKRAVYLRSQRLERMFWEAAKYVPDVDISGERFVEVRLRRLSAAAAEPQRLTGDPQMVKRYVRLQQRLFSIYKEAIRAAHGSGPAGGDRAAPPLMRIVSREAVACLQWHASFTGPAQGLATILNAIDGAPTYTEEDVSNFGVKLGGFLDLSCLDFGVTLRSFAEPLVALPAVCTGGLFAIVEERSIPEGMIECLVRPLAGLGRGRAVWGLSNMRTLDCSATAHLPKTLAPIKVFHSLQSRVSCRADHRGGSGATPDATGGSGAMPDAAGGSALLPALPQFTLSPSYGGALSLLDRITDLFVRPTEDASRRLSLWDRMRLQVHGVHSMLCIDAPCRVRYFGRNSTASHTRLSSTLSSECRAGAMSPEVLDTVFGDGLVLALDADRIILEFERASVLVQSAEEAILHWLYGASSFCAKDLGLANLPAAFSERAHVPILYFPSVHLEMSLCTSLGRATPSATSAPSSAISGGRGASPVAQAKGHAQVFIHAINPMADAHADRCRAHYYEWPAEGAFGGEGAPCRPPGSGIKPKDTYADFRAKSVNMTIRLTDVLLSARGAEPPGEKEGAEDFVDHLEREQKRNKRGLLMVYHCREMQSWLARQFGSDPSGLAEIAAAARTRGGPLFSYAYMAKVAAANARASACGDRAKPPVGTGLGSILRDIHVHLSVEHFFGVRFLQFADPYSYNGLMLSASEQVSFSLLWKRSDFRSATNANFGRWFLHLCDIDSKGMRMGVITSETVGESGVAASGGSSAAGQRPNLKSRGLPSGASYSDMYDMMIAPHFSSVSINEACFKHDPIAFSSQQALVDERLLQLNDRIEQLARRLRKIDPHSDGKTFGETKRALALLLEESDYMGAFVKKDRCTSNAVNDDLVHNHHFVIQNAQLIWHQCLRDAFFSVIDQMRHFGKMADSLSLSILQEMLPSKYYHHHRQDSSASVRGRSSYCASPVYSPGRAAFGGAATDMAQATLEALLAPLGVAIDADFESEQGPNGSASTGGAHLQECGEFDDPIQLRLVRGVEVRTLINVNFKNAHIVFYDTESSHHQLGDAAGSGRSSRDAAVIVTVQSASLKFGTAYAKAPSVAGGVDDESLSDVARSLAAAHGDGSSLHSPPPSPSPSLATSPTGARADRPKRADLHLGNRTKVVLENAQLHSAFASHFAPSQWPPVYPMDDGIANDSLLDRFGQISERLKATFVYDLSNSSATVAGGKSGGKGSGAAPNATGEGRSPLFASGGQIRVRADSIGLLTTSSQYWLLYNVIVNLLVYRDATQKMRHDQLESLMLGKNIFDEAEMEHLLMETQANVLRLKRAFASRVSSSGRRQRRLAQQEQEREGVSSDGGAKRRKSASPSLRSRPVLPVGEHDCRSFGILMQGWNELAIVVEALRLVRQSAHRLMDRQTRLHLDVIIGRIQWTLLDDAGSDRGVPTSPQYRGGSSSESRERRRREEEARRKRRRSPLPLFAREQGGESICDFVIHRLHDAWLSSEDGSQSNVLEILTLGVTNRRPSAFYRTLIAPVPAAERGQLTSRRGTAFRGIGAEDNALRLFFKALPAVAGIAVLEHFEINLIPMQIRASYDILNEIFRFFFPKRDASTPPAASGSPMPPSSQAGGGGSGASGSGAAPSLGLVNLSSNSAISRRASGDFASSLSLVPSSGSSTTNLLTRFKDASLMKARADANCSFVYVNVPASQHIISFKSRGDSAFTNVEDFILQVPDIEYHSRLWSWTELIGQLRKDAIRVLASNIGALFKDRIRKWRQPSMAASERGGEEAAAGGDAPSRRMSIRTVEDFDSALFEAGDDGCDGGEAGGGLSRKASHLRVPNRSAGPDSQEEKERKARLILGKSYRP